ncbi:unnamed protein product [Phyllotreta striolata]|uniref:Neural Wiskott-Aldrich syndrome protein n=1 Tax=Phyllotreta striolata TaxID=444603 RepID=A0A9N9TTS2_PHYSR|nr:unnamed protein product [Phyllotreta striolata]
MWPIRDVVLMYRFLYEKFQGNIQETALLLYREMAPVLDNHYSGILTSEENLQVFKLLGNRCQSLCTTVVQLYLTKPPEHSHWFKKSTGILCFVKDNTKKNFFFRLFCIQRNMKVWEHQMYNNMEYIEGTPFFHMFEGENCLVAFNFANIEEARDLRIVVHQKIQARKRREEKRCRQISQSQTLPSPTTHLNLNYKKTLDPSVKNNKRKKVMITKKDIGIPRDFKHISHVGWNSTSGFDISTEDEQLKAFFKKAGVSERHLKDKKTREYIYEFINANGGREVIDQTNEQVDNHVAAPPAVPPRAPHLVQRPPHVRIAPPPPIPNKNSINSARKSRMDVPPPRKPAPVPNAAPSATSTPPPPPPPPPVFEEAEKDHKPGAPPPPPPLDSFVASINEGNSALLESIRNGTTLKRVEARTIAPAQEDPRGDLLSEIRKGCKLRPVDERELKPTPSAPTSRSDDLASALARALAKRSEVIHSEEDDDGGASDSGDSEWDD